MSEQWLTIEDFSYETGYSTYVVDRLIYTKELPNAIQNRHRIWEIPESDFKAYLDRKLESNRKTYAQFRVNGTEGELFKMRLFLNAHKDGISGYLKQIILEEMARRGEE